MSIRAIVTDIEGTTSSLAFVKDVLFPYARAHMHDFIRQQGDRPEVREQLGAVEREAGAALSREQAADLLVTWIDEDRKITPLKALQGLIWQHGYQNGAFQGHIYADAVAALRRWHQQGIRLYVYSSGSVKAQQLLFAHTAFGDLTGLFSGWFDTRIGAKTEQASYRQIITDIGLPAEQILFLSDAVKELDAAVAAGMRVLQLVRDHTVVTTDHVQVVDFDAIATEQIV